MTHLIQSLPPQTRMVFTQAEMQETDRLPCQHIHPLLSFLKMANRNNSSWTPCQDLGRILPRCSTWEVLKYPHQATDKSHFLNVAPPVVWTPANLVVVSGLKIRTKSITFPIRVDPCLRFVSWLYCSVLAAHHIDHKSTVIHSCHYSTISHSFIPIFNFCTFFTTNLIKNI